MGGKEEGNKERKSGTGGNDLSARRAPIGWMTRAYWLDDAYRFGSLPPAYLLVG